MRCWAFRFGDDSWRNAGSLTAPTKAEAQSRVAEYRRAWRIDRGATHIAEIEPVVIQNVSCHWDRVRLTCGADERVVPLELVSEAVCDMRLAQLNRMDREGVQ